jgi:hypothetical protein
MLALCPLCSFGHGEQEDILLIAQTGKCLRFFVESKIPPFRSVVFIKFILFSSLSCIEKNILPLLCLFHAFYW